MGSFQSLSGEVETLGLTRLLMIASGSAKTAADDLAERLGTRVVGRVHEVRQHVPESRAEEARRMAEGSEADGIISIGGGSATGLGKAVAVTSGLPLVAVPTTYSGSEATPVFAVTGVHKTTGRDPQALPRLAVYDALLTTALPRHVTVTSGLNALAHCVEALYAPRANPVTSLLAEEGVRVLTRAIPQVVDGPDDLEGRSDALYGAYLAGSAMAAAGTGLHHTLCHVMGGSYSLEHGDLHAVLLPHVAAYNTPSAPAALSCVARAMRTTDAATGLHRLAHDLGAPTDLAALGMPEDGLDDVAARTVAAIGDRNPRPVDTKSLRRLLDDAYAGRPPGLD